MNTVRLDKWLWAVRLYKTRTLATDACRRGRILVNGLTAKPSKEIREGDHITIRKLPVVYSYIVRQIVERRLPAKLVSDYIDNQTSVEELDKLKINEIFYVKRDKGTGRPTKKHRRQIDDLERNMY
jgi:ribosome-associated heat shock protein Hsp15